MHLRPLAHSKAPPWIKYLEDDEGVILVQDWVLDEVEPEGFFEENFNWDCGLVPHALSTCSLRANYKSEA